MPVSDRDEWERKLARKLGIAFSELDDDWYELLQQYGWDLERIPSDPMVQKKKKILIPFLFSIAISSAEELLRSSPGGVDWALINGAANDWARSYSTFLAGNIHKTSRGAVARALRNTIAAFFDEGLTHEELVRRLKKDKTLAQLFTADIRDKLGRVYGPYRASMIATTEVTRASVEGGRLVADELARQGIRLVEVWQTAKDELVCPICAPRDGQPEGSNWTRNDGPPAHPRCRCDVGHQIAK